MTSLAGSINFTIDGVSVGSAPLSSNVATPALAGTFVAGTHTVVAT